MSDGFALSPPRSAGALWRICFERMITSTSRHRNLISHHYMAAVTNMVKSALAALFIATALPSFCQPAQQQSLESNPAELLQGVPDVTIFVVPTSGDTARVSLAYRKRIPHKQVLQEISNLKAFGWGIGTDIGISDGSLRPGDTERAPVTTFGHFSLFKAPQVQNNAPVLLPYLQAFQELNHISVVFNISTLSPYNGVNQFDSSQLTVRRMPEDGAYHYEALILDHSGKLADLSARQSASPSTPRGDSNVSAPKPSSIPLLPLMLILSGVGILGGLAAYGFVARRVSGALPTRNSRS